jgi:hypothetical protein
MVNITCPTDHNVLSLASYPMCAEYVLLFVFTNILFAGCAFVCLLSIGFAIMYYQDCLKRRQQDASMQPTRLTASVPTAGIV